MKLEKTFTIKDEARFRREFRKWREERNRRRIPFEHRSKGEQLWDRIEACCWEINGEGLEGFFDNADGDRAYDMIRDFKTIGAKTQRASSREQFNCFRAAGCPRIPTSARRSSSVC